MTEPPRPGGDPGQDPAAPSSSPYTVPGETPGSGYSPPTTPAPSSGAGGGYSMPGGSDYTPPAPSSGGGYTTPATSGGDSGYAPPESGGYAQPSSGAGYAPPPSSGAGYAPPSSGAGYAPPSSGAGYAPPSSGAGYPGQASGAGHTYPSEQAYNQQPGPAYGAAYGGQPGGYGVQPGYGPQPGGYGPPPQGYPTNDDKTYALIAHWGGVAGVFLGGGALGWVGPLIAYMAKGTQSPVVRAHAVTALNFHITWAGAYVASIILAIVTCGVLFFVPMLVFLVPLIFGIIGGIKATNGEYYQYPMAIPMIK
ncbi:DUF4870 domain-containing protein [Virgisporangium aurantiacum]|nr:DUF4870 domain-containing protein [Virgisporangium aurantiacum]